MSEQPTGAHPPADRHPVEPVEPVDALDSLSGPDDALSGDALSSEPYLSRPGKSEPPQNQTIPGPTSAPVPAPQGPSEPADPAAGPTVPAAPGTSRRFSPVLKRLGVVLIGVVVVVVGRAAFDRGSADVLEVGQCVSRDGNEIAQVDCTDQKAKYKVLLIQKDAAKSSIESVCSVAPATTTSYFESKEGETQGNVICLSDLS